MDTLSRSATSATRRRRRRGIASPPHRARAVRQRDVATRRDATHRRDGRDVATPRSRDARVRFSATSCTRRRVVYMAKSRAVCVKKRARARFFRDPRSPRKARTRGSASSRGTSQIRTPCPPSLRCAIDATRRARRRRRRRRRRARDARARRRDARARRRRGRDDGRGTIDRG